MLMRLVLEVAWAAVGLAAPVCGSLRPCKLAVAALALATPFGRPCWTPCGSKSLKTSAGSESGSAAVPRAKRRAPAVFAVTATACPAWTPTSSNAGSRNKRVAKPERRRRGVKARRPSVRAAAVAVVAVAGAR